MIYIPRPLASLVVYCPPPVDLAHMKRERVAGVTDA